MMTSTTTLAIGTSAGTLLTTSISALIMGALAMYTLLHHKQVFAWMQKIRRKDEENSELDKPSEWLADLYKAQCRLAQRPCRADELEDVVQIANMLKGVADHTETIRLEVVKVVELADDYIATALPDPGPNMKISLVEHRTQLVRAMKQEAARAELARAVLTAQQKIKSMRRS
ncbi:hypothetical protein AB0H94_35920 [Streptomyces purpurascens]|jgi:hypothetical protein|uniref:hypothetical protein n=1 Tax=Streptomyces purpurascens TaxID=1924 RepID=UPI0033D73B8F